MALRCNLSVSLLHQAKFPEYYQYEGQLGTPALTEENYEVTSLVVDGFLNGANWSLAERRCGC
jgi:hypothetical protein